MDCYFHSVPSECPSRERKQVTNAKWGATSPPSYGSLCPQEKCPQQTLQRWSCFCVRRLEPPQPNPHRIPGTMVTISLCSHLPGCMEGCPWRDHTQSYLLCGKGSPAWCNSPRFSRPVWHELFGSWWSTASRNSDFLQRPQTGLEQWGKLWLRWRHKILFHIWLAEPQLQLLLSVLWARNGWVSFQLLLNVVW